MIPGCHRWEGPGTSLGQSLVLDRQEPLLAPSSFLSRDLKPENILLDDHGKTGVQGSGGLCCCWTQLGPDTIIPPQDTSASQIWAWQCMCLKGRRSRVVWALWATWVSAGHRHKLLGLLCTAVQRLLLQL